MSLRSRSSDARANGHLTRRGGRRTVRGASGVPTARSRALRWGLAVGTASLVIFLIALYLPTDLPSRIRAASAPSSFIYDRGGALLYELYDPEGGAQRTVSLEQVPEALIQAVIATEDAGFYHNAGLSPRAILRALGLNLQAGRIVSGGSTITQQVARQLLLGSGRYDQTLVRKLREAWLALRLNAVLSKDEILALYLNHTYFGNLFYGVDAASRGYYGKPVRDLSLAESALLAGIPQSPVAYNPLNHLESARERQRTVLDLMVRAAYIDEQTAARAHAEPLTFAGSPYSLRSPHFSVMVRDELSRLVGEGAVAHGGLSVRTTLDWGLQERAEQIVALHLAELNVPADDAPSRRVGNAAAVVLDSTGAVRALVGSADYWDTDTAGAVNGATALRQPGSALKPLTYAAAFERGYSPATSIADVSTVFRTAEGTAYVPVNYDGREHGLVSLREALANSYNIAAVRLLDAIGVQALPEMAQRLGIDTLNDPNRQGLALTLGGAEVRLLDLTAAYASFAAEGRLVPARLIEQVTDGEGNVLYQYSPAPTVQAIDPRIAYLVTDVLSDGEARVPAFGRAGALDLPYPAAVKTGTSNQWRDNWTIGYTPSWTVGVWVGNADGSSMQGATGLTGAAPIWNSLMRTAHRQPPPTFVVPEGLVEVEVCPLSGQLPGPACTQRRLEWFLKESAPVEQCDLHTLVAQDALTGARAEQDTPPERVIVRSAVIWPPEMLQWAIDSGLDSETGLASGDARAGTPSTDAPIRLGSPADGDVFRISTALPAESQRLRITAVCGICQGGGRLSLELDGKDWHEWTGPPYTVYWGLTEGDHVLTLAYSDGAGMQRRSAPVRIKVVRAKSSGGVDQ